jgi:hypothetical protein
MKKQLALALLATLALSVSASAASRGAAGCGLGNMLFKNEPGMVQILAATTNGTSGNQTFGITSGTSGCAEGGLFAASRESEVYAEVNFRQLQSEIAAGQGEYLNSLAGLLGVSAERRTEFFQLARVRYSSLFPTPDAGSTELLEGLTKALQDHPELMG